MEKLVEETRYNKVKEVLDPRVYRMAKVVIPVVVKADSLGTLDAVIRELKKRETKDVKIKIVAKGIGSLTEGDIMLASSDKETVIMTFAVKDDGKARDQADRFGFTVYPFDIIYKLAEWFDTVVEDRLPFEEVEEVLGKLTLIKAFSTQKDNHVIGGKVTQGVLKLGALVKIERRSFDLGKGKITELQMQKIKTKEVQEGNECGLMIESKTEMIPGDIIIAYVMTKKKLA